MSFAGWGLSQLGILFAAGGAAITLLYLLRMRRRQVVVPFAALWERVTRESESRQIWRKLRRLVSWLVQLIVLAMVCLALGDPRPEVWLRDPVTVALVVDRSASMAGPVQDGEEGETRLSAAKTRAIAEVHALGPVDQAVLITAGEEVSVAAPLSRDPTVLVPAIESIEPSYGESDLQRALALARHAVGNQPGARIVVMTDGALDPAGAAALSQCVGGELTCQVVPLSGPPGNVAITAFAARRYPTARDKVEVLVEVRNLGDQPAAALLDVQAEGVSVGKRPLELAPGQVTREVLPDLDAARSELIARLEPPTQPPAGFDTDLGPAFDDTAYAVVPPLEPLEVALVSDGTDLFLDAALLSLADHVRLSGVSVEDALSDPPKELLEADLVFYDVGDHPLPESLPETNVVLFDPWRHETSPSPVAKQSDIARPFLTEQSRKHPVLEDVVLKDVNIARGTSFEIEPGDTVLVRSLGEPMAVLREQDHVTMVVGFEPRQSDFALRPAFPVFIENIVRYVEQRTPGFVAAVRLGQSRELALADLGLPPDGVSRVSVRGPEGDPVQLPVEQGRFWLRALTPGIYGITSLDGESANATVRVAVNQASVDASDLHPRFEAADVDEQAHAPEPAAPAPVSEGPLWTAIMLIVAAMIVIEWATYHRRVTV